MSAQVQAQGQQNQGGADALENQENEGYRANRITVLQEHGINVADIKKLQAAGVCTVEALQMSTKKDITNIRGITEARYLSLLSAGEKVSDRAAGKFKSAGQLRQDYQARFHVSTGSTELDSLLGGGMESCAMSELYGEYRTGKTQICHTLAISAQLGQNAGKVNSKTVNKDMSCSRLKVTRFTFQVIYVDTEGTFRPERLVPICERFMVDSNTALENIIVARVYTCDVLQELPAQMEAALEDDQFALIIIDSLMALWRNDYVGRGELSERQQKLGYFLNLLKKISERHNVAVVYTNLVMSDPGAGKNKNYPYQDS